MSITFYTFYIVLLTSLKHKNVKNTRNNALPLYCSGHSHDCPRGNQMGITQKTFLQLITLILIFIHLFNRFCFRYDTSLHYFVYLIIYCSFGHIYWKLKFKVNIISKKDEAKRDGVREKHTKFTILLNSKCGKCCCHKALRFVDCSSWLR